MKHILNNLSEQEKNAIREQHTGGMKVMTENFSKLTKSKLGDSKPLVTEQSEMEVMDEPKHDINKVMDLAYEIMELEAPDGPRNSEQYLKAIKKLEHSFNYAIRNLKGNVGGGF
jgi:hypothetical protein